MASCAPLRRLGTAAPLRVSRQRRLSAWRRRHRPLRTTRGTETLFRHLLRAIVWIALRTVYRMRVEGLGNVPREGAAVLVPNHVSFLDAVLIASHVRRPIRFAMHFTLYRPFAPVLRALGAFPIASRTEDPEICERAFGIMEETIRDGCLLCVFPEGQLTRDGAVGEFRGGIARTLARQPCPVLPVALSNLWGSWFSRRTPGWAKLPRHFGARVGMEIGLPLPSDASPSEMRVAVVDLLERRGTTAGTSRSPRPAEA